MYIIAVYPSLALYRDQKLTNLLGGHNIVSRSYLYRRVKYFNSTSLLSMAQRWKRLSSAENILKKWETTKSWREFGLPSNSHLVIEKLSLSEWNSYIDGKIQAEKNRSSYAIDKLNRERLNYR